jgi:hypothetical protein
MVLTEGSRGVSELRAAQLALFSSSCRDDVCERGYQCVILSQTDYVATMLTSLRLQVFHRSFHQILFPFPFFPFLLDLPFRRLLLRYFWRVRLPLHPAQHAYVFQRTFKLHLSRSSFPRPGTSPQLLLCIFPAFCRILSSIKPSVALPRAL